MSDTRRALQEETEAARSLLANVRDIIGDDEEAVRDAIEGETNLIEAIEATVARIAEVEAHQDAIATQIKAMGERKSRFEAQGERLRTALTVAMGAADLKKLELPLATLSRKPVPPKAVITNETDIPSKFWKPSDPKLDRKAVLDALKAKETVPGAELSNGSETIAIKWS